MIPTYHRNEGEKGPSFTAQYLDAKGAYEAAEETLWLFLGRVSRETITLDDDAPSQTRSNIATRRVRILMDEADEAHYHLRYVKDLFDRQRALQARIDAEEATARALRLRRFRQ